MKRQKFNEVAQRVGNSVHKGLGNLLTKEVKLGEALGVTGAISLPFIYANIVCGAMYANGIVDKMYSQNIAERLAGFAESVPYEIGWLIVLPTSTLLGMVSGGILGEKLDRI
jgi:hypothetical protein